MSDTPKEIDRIDAILTQMEQMVKEEFGYVKNTSILDEYDAETIFTACTTLDKEKAKESIQLVLQASRTQMLEQAIEVVERLVTGDAQKSVTDALRALGGPK